MKNKFFMIALLPVILLGFNTAQILAYEPASIFLEQIASTETGQLAVNVIVSDVADLYGAEVRLRYDPLILQPLDTDPNQEAVQVEPGSFPSPEQGFVVANRVDEAHGTISYAITLLNPAPPATGQGVLFKAAFKVLRPNASTLSIEHAKLVAHNLETIPNQTQSLSFGAAPPLTETEARAELAQQDNVWWMVAGGIIMVIGLGLATAVIAAKKTANNRSNL